MLIKLKSFYKHLRRKIYCFWYKGQNKECPICQFKAREFISYGVNKRKDACCPSCGMVERHRLAWIYLKKMLLSENSDNVTFLHIAPEHYLSRTLRGIFGKGYITADLHDPQADVKMNITDIQYSDDTFDIIYCSHVLEHIQHDRRAMSELYRVLKPNGTALLLVPITAEYTIEDPSVTDKKERLRLFGQEDHVRKYGRDYIDRLRDTGFTVIELKPEDFIAEEDLYKFGLTTNAAGTLFICTKIKT